MSYTMDMNFADKSGTTKQHRLMQVMQSTPESSAAHQMAEEELSAAPELPFYLEHVWNWFWELSSRRGSNGYSQNPITWTDFGHWNALKRRQATPTEFEILEILDRLYLKYLNDKNTKDTPNGNIPAKKSKKR